MSASWILIVGFSSMVYLLVKICDVDRKTIERQQKIINYLKELEQTKYELQKQSEKEKQLNQLDDVEV
jgi:hypothetical protein